LTDYINWVVDAMMTKANGKGHTYDVVNEAINGNEKSEFVES